MVNFDNIVFEAWMRTCDDIIPQFEEFVPENVEDADDLFGYVYQAGIWLEKAAEEDEPDNAAVRHGSRRPVNRAERRKATAHAKMRRQRMAMYSADEICPRSGKIKNTGFRSYEKGAKAWTRKMRHTPVGMEGQGYYEENHDTGIDDYDCVGRYTGLDICPDKDGLYTDRVIECSIFRYNNLLGDYDNPEGYLPDDDYMDEWEVEL